MKLEHSMHPLCRGKMSTKCVNTSQRCINNAHQKGQRSSTLDVPQLRQLEPFPEQMVMACMLWKEKWEVYWTDCFFTPQDLVEIQVEQPPKERWLSRIPRAWESWWLQVWGWHLCLSWTFSGTQSKGHSGLATGFGNCGWLGKCTQAKLISSKK